MPSASVLALRRRHALGAPIKHFDMTRKRGSESSASRRQRRKSAAAAKVARNQTGPKPNEADLEAHPEEAELFLWADPSLEPEEPKQSQGNELFYGHAELRNANPYTGEPYDCEKAWRYGADYQQVSPKELIRRALRANAWHQLKQ